MTCDPLILQLVSGAKLNFTRHVKQNKAAIPIKCNYEDKCKIDTEIDKYVKLGIVEKTTHSQGEFISNIFPRPKKSGGVRIILNLKPLNIDIEYQHFKMENFKTVVNLIEENCYMASIDLQDAYYSVNICESDKKFLRFLWNGQLYQFSCLPNGLTSAPRWFTKLMKPIFSELRRQGFVSVYYLDDTWLMGRTESECLNNVRATADILQKAGFIINIVKSNFQPLQKVSFLGFILDSVNMTVCLSNEKRNKIMEYCQCLLNEDSVFYSFCCQSNWHPCC